MDVRVCKTNRELENDRINFEFRNQMGQILEVNTERRERLEAQGDFAIATEQQLSDVWHKALTNPTENQQQESFQNRVG